MKNIEQIRDGYPATGSPHIRVLAIIAQIITKAIRQNKIPKSEAINNGRVEKAIIPSSE